jgi:hypothetical protein
MPITSAQTSGLIGGQQAMFGNVATYAQQIGGGSGPTYANPMAGAGYGPAGLPGTAAFNQGMAATPGMLSAVGTYAPVAMAGAGMMMGGRAGALLDPTTAALRGFGSGVGWRAGAGLGTNLGVVARGGVGGIARGIGMAGWAAAPAMALYTAGRYAAGQMIEGAQFQNQVGQTLQQSFRFTNPQSRTGYGFTQVGQRQIGRMLQNLGAQDVMTTPQELLGVVQQGAQMGMFRGIQDARQFRERFRQMKETLTEVAKTFNTTLSEALPFFQQARQMGFWTPQDVTRHATQVRQVQANTGMSAAQAQGVMAMGAQMTRSMGGTGQQGAEMMARAQAMTGAALYGNVVSSQQLAEAGFGTGAQGAQNLGNMLAGATARFARSRVGRWALASMMNREGTGLDPNALQAFTTGGMTVGQMGAAARRNVAGGRAYQFVLNEGELRGQLAQQGPEAAMGIVRSLTGSRLYGSSARDRLITRRIIQRFMGGTARQADIVARMAKEMPRLMDIQMARTDAAADSQERQRQQMMSDTWEGWKRELGHWWEQNVSNPMQKAGAEFSFRVGRAWQRFSDRIFRTGGRGVSLSDEAVRAMSLAAQTGNQQYITEAFGTEQMYQQAMGGVGVGADPRLMQFMGVRPGARTGMTRMWTAGQRLGGLFGGWGRRAAETMMLGRGVRPEYTTEQVERAEAMQRGAQGMVGEMEARALGFGGTREMMQAQRGEAAQQIQAYLRGGEALAVRGQMGGGRLGAEGQREHARRMLTMIRAGRAGEAARSMVEGLNEPQAIARLQALQGAGGRGFAGIQAFGGDLWGQTQQDLRTRIEEIQEDAAEGMAVAMRGGIADVMPANRFAAEYGGIRGVAVTEASVEELKKDDRGARAFRLYARAEAAGSAEEATRLRTEARQLMAEVGNDPDSSEELRSAAIKLAKGDLDPHSAGMSKAAAEVGRSLMIADRQQFAEKVEMRMARTRGRLGREGMRRLMDVAGEGAAGQDLRRAMEDVLQARGAGRPGTFAEVRFEQVRRLSSLLARDPDRAGQILATLKAEGAGGSELAALAEGAMQTAAMARQFGVREDEEETIRGGRGRQRRARAGVQAVLERMKIGGISQRDVVGLIREDQESQSRLRDELKRRNWKAEDIDAFIQDISGGFTAAEMQRRGMAATEAGVMTRYSEQVAKEGGLKKGELSLTGKEGSPKGMHEELKVHTVWFRKMYEALGAISREEKLPAPSEDKTKKGK